MITVVTCVKDRENERVQKAIDSVRQLEAVKEVIVVDYGSEKPVEVSCDKIIRFDKNPIFNKSHALNLGIKAASQPYIMTLDCDIIVPRECLLEIPELLGENVFIVSTDVMRIEIKDLSDLSKAWSWYSDTNQSVNNRFNSKANGGMQVFSKKWAEKVHGYDENLILLGGPDNDMFNRAILDGLVMIDLNKKIYHQEHKQRKEEILPQKDRLKASRIRLMKSKYIWEKQLAGQVVVPGQWGEEVPNQDMFMNYWNNDKKIEKEKKEKQEKFLQDLKVFVEKSGVEVSDINVRW